MYATGTGVTKNNAEAAKWFRKAAQQGHLAAQTALGDMLASGSGITQDDNEAVEWFRKAAEQGHREAQHRLAERYEHGTGITKDNIEAVKWFHRSAEQGYQQAKYRLGVKFRDGHGVPQNHVQAYAWLSLANSWEKDELREQLSATQLAQARELSIALYLKELIRHQKTGLPVQLRLNEDFLRRLSDC